MSHSQEIVRKRVSILHRYLSYVCDPTDTRTAEDLISLRQRFARAASVLKDGHTEDLEHFIQLAKLCPDPTEDRIERMYDNIRNLGEMARIAFPRLSSPFN